jgi:hypothetical protein
MIPTGVFEWQDAPHWIFTCDGMIVFTVKQWMGEAATYFAVQMSKTNAGGETTVEILYMSLDGMTGYYQVTFEHHPFPSLLVVRRDNQTKVTELDDHEQL